MGCEGGKIAMTIKKIYISTHGYVKCKSCFYSSLDVISDGKTYCLSSGVNMMRGEIDSGVWAVSYLLSMYAHSPRDFVLFEPAEALVDGKTIGLDALAERACYMDRLHPLFRSNASVRRLIAKGIHKSGSRLSVDEICDMFMLDDERSRRSLSACGNEDIQAMAAIAYAAGKEIYCFPWHSAERFDGYHLHMTWLLQYLEHLQMIAVVPIGNGR